MNHEVIRISEATKKFGNHIVLNNVSAFFESNKIHGIIGRNGSGKTMLFKCIIGFVPLTSGSIIVNEKTVGKDIDMPDDIGIIIETPGFLPNYSGLGNLKLLAGLKNTIQKDRILDCMRMVGLDPALRKGVGRYSMGMRQRLGIAQAIMENPSVLILDEPMNGLDQHGVSDIRKLLLELKGSGTTILLASHNKDDIETLCDHVYEMDAGSITPRR